MLKIQFYCCCSSWRQRKSGSHLRFDADDKTISEYTRLSGEYMILQLIDNQRRMFIRVITKLPNSEQSYKGKVKTHNYMQFPSFFLTVIFIQSRWEFSFKIHGVDFVEKNTGWRGERVGSEASCPSSKSKSTVITWSNENTAFFYKPQKYLFRTSSIWAVKWHWLDTFLLYRVTAQNIAFQIPDSSRGPKGRLAYCC